MMLPEKWSYASAGSKLISSSVVPTTRTFDGAGAVKRTYAAAPPTRRMTMTTTTITSSLRLPARTGVAGSGVPKFIRPLSVTQRGQPSGHGIRCAVLSVFQRRRQGSSDVQGALPTAGTMQALDGLLHPVAGKFPLVAEKTEDGSLVRGFGSGNRFGRHGRVREETPNRFERRRQCGGHFHWSTIEGFPFLNPLDRGLRSNPFHAFVEVRTHENRDIDQLVSREAEVREVLFQVEDFRRHVPGAPLTWEEFGRADGQESDHPRGAEQEGVVIFRPRGPDIPAPREERGLRLPLARGLNPWNAEQTEERLRFFDHRPRQPRGHHGFGPRRRGVSRSDGDLILPLRLLADLASLADLRPLQLRRRTVEYEHGMNFVIGDEARRPEHQAVEVRSNPTLGILQGRPIAGAHDREKLIQFEIAVDRDGAAMERLEGRWMADRDRSEEDTHAASTPTAAVNLCGLSSDGERLPRSSKWAASKRSTHLDPLQSHPAA